MTPGRLSPQSKFTLVPSHGSTFVYTKCHAGASHPGVSAPRFFYRGENFTPARNLAAVSCKREMTTRFGVKSVWLWNGMGSPCVMFAILNHTSILSK